MRSKHKITYQMAISSLLKSIPLIILAGIFVFGIKYTVERFTPYHLSFLYILLLLGICGQINKRYGYRATGAKPTSSFVRRNYKLNRNQWLLLIGATTIGIFLMLYALSLTKLVWSSMPPSTGFLTATMKELLTQKDFFAIACNMLAFQVFALVVFPCIYFHRAPGDKTVVVMLYFMIGFMIFVDYSATVAVRRAVASANGHPPSFREITNNMYHLGSKA